MSITGTRSTPDADGWLSHRIGTGDHTVTIDCRREARCGRPAVVQVYVPTVSGGRVHCIEPEAVALAVGVLLSGDCFGALFDWLLERVELTGRWHYGEEKWVYADDWRREVNTKVLEEAIRLTVQAEGTT